MKVYDSVSPNFKSLYSVHDVTINGKNFGPKHRNVLNEVTRALATQMFNNSLSKDVSQKVNKLFPDFVKDRFSAVAGADYRQYWVNILAGNDAIIYRSFWNNRQPIDIKRSDALDFLKRRLKQTGYKQISITAEEKNGLITITDIQRFFKPGKTR